MNKFYVKENLYDKNGVLLLAKGQEITEEVIFKLKKWKDVKRISPYNENNVIPKSSDNRQINQYSKNLKTKYNITDVNSIITSTDIINNILFDSKKKSWWIFINALSNYIDWVYSHSINVAILSLITAINLGYRKNQLEKIALGALLHDIGKLLIPKEIIEKPDKLNENDIILIQKHCELGFDMIKKLDLPNECNNIILQHHERLDGSGYPYGLKNDETSTEAKIVSIIDALDAMTSYRPYNKVKKINEAFDELNSNDDKFEKEILLILESIINY